MQSHLRHVKECLFIFGLLIALAGFSAIAAKTKTPSLPENVQDDSRIYSEISEVDLPKANVAPAIESGFSRLTALEKRHHERLPAPSKKKKSASKRI